MTVLVLFAAWRGRLPVRVAGLLYALAMGFALVYAGEHYAVDLVAGAAVAALAWRVAGAGDRVWLRRPLRTLARRV